MHICTLKLDASRNCFYVEVYIHDHRALKTETMDWKYFLRMREYYKHSTPFVIEPQSTVLSNHPRIMLWDPISQFPKLKIACPMHGNVLFPTNKWHDCKKRKPRKLFDMNGTVHLVGRIYQCDSIIQSHKIVSTDEGILSSAKQQHATVPFKLQQRSGFTSTLVDYIIHRYINFSFLLAFS